MKAWIDNLLYKVRKRRFCKLNRWFCPDCIYHDFIFEGAIFKGNNCRFPRKGAGALERLVKTEPQKKEVEWVYNKRERLWYPYLDGELLFKTENSQESPCTNCSWKEVIPCCCCMEFIAWKRKLLQMKEE